MNLLLNGTQDGDSGLIILAIDAVGGYSLTLGAQFSTAKNMGGQALALTANSYNCMSWWNIGGIVYYRNI